MMCSAAAHKCAQSAQIASEGTVFKFLSMISSVQQDRVQRRSVVRAIAGFVASLLFLPGCNSRSQQFYSVEVRNSTNERIINVRAYVAAAKKEFVISNILPTFGMTWMGDPEVPQLPADWEVSWDDKAHAHHVVIVPVGRPDAVLSDDRTPTVSFEIGESDHVMVHWK
jgi:hypothetical protein